MQKANKLLAAFCGVYITNHEYILFSTIYLKLNYTKLNEFCIARLALVSAILKGLLTALLGKFACFTVAFLGYGGILGRFITIYALTFGNFY